MTPFFIVTAVKTSNLKQDKVSTSLHLKAGKYPVSKMRNFLFV
jgi:hypothetical protein